MNPAANSSITLQKYKDTTKRLLTLSFPGMKESDFDAAIDYSINKRLHNTNASIYNNYKHQRVDSTLLEIADYIYSREPILTAYGVMFRKHREKPEPLLKVIQSFLDNRAKDKKIMFSYEKGSEDYEHWNLIQLLDKIDANGVFGILTMNASLVYNLHVGASILAQSRSQISSLSMLFEMFLANNVKFGSLDEIMVYIDNVLSERKSRQFRDCDLLDHDIPVQQVFGHLVMMCGWLWIPEQDDLEIIWDVLQNLPQDDLNRIYYKNNLYEFMNNKSMTKALHDIIVGLQEPYLEPMKPPKEIQAELDVFRDIICEYVYYSYQIPDRIDRNANMIKSVIMISDTDSCIISLDAWYRFGLTTIGTEKIPITRILIDPIREISRENYCEDGKPRFEAITIEEPDLDYDFYNDEVVEKEHWINPIAFLPQDNVRYSIINIMAYVLDKVVNDYMLKFTKANFSYSDYIPCKIIAKNEYLFKRAILNGKKNYASYQEIQEGNFIPPDKALDVKGIQALAKSDSPESTKAALNKILIEDILNADNIDQVKIIKDLAIVEHEILNSISSGSKEYYKPANVKATQSYADPMRIQGVKASVVWNELRTGDQEVLDMDQRNHVEIAKVILNKSTVYKLQDFPEVYEKAVNLLQRKEFAGGITAIAIPSSENVPEWLTRIIDIDTIVRNNISGFPLEPLNIKRLDKPVCLSNILKL